MYQFTGFTQDDFNIFLIPEFHDRMSAVRTRIRPKLAMIGDDLAPKLSELLHHPIYPHTASHARRRVNPPDDTWVSFSRNERGYKRFAHFEVGITLDYVFVRFVVKREGEDDKPILLQYLKSRGQDAFQLSDPSTIYWYKDDHGVDPFPIEHITSEKMQEIIRHTEVKSHGFTVGVIFERTNPIVGKAELITRAYNAIVHLSPLYLGSVPSEALSK
ncbi:DUF1054 family protein [Sulfobacillus thermosulfidooxidans]|uniref:Uncharacterized protein YktB, UPF0637 family n=2 Tax=Sulfobacillus thermosulfidooxidans TaxID=28034 RepID=A0A1W1WE73_SULTA|nr:DUF1054 family protein [Sulfobacillus thermosulfidooxidans]OLZ11784.1 hypothetical protein BFX05_07295 [Sulfobacillus thermosulfidooxidans]OLZ17078.1 hypothetical protein BFX06_14180 [Sulfobacillus thermosulfidooxidans]OLZ20174.1 hypothetical protein BFX07_00910 [Sulfobacillus thermosulfidooxidans]PSR27078.1 MAG: DUF1054 domain-containing protein [Sulfobacillus thermosulfidooxidans]SMC04525.1 Uncharacterized protein YktB, UPF0637 family [Sulfobacillus thermosulfidooxidans DSM 9293]